MGCGIKGLAFTTDGILATTVALTVMLSTIYAIQAANRNDKHDLASVKTAYDIGLAFDRAGILASNNETLITQALENYRPDNMNVSLHITRYAWTHGNLTVVNLREYGNVQSESYTTQQVVSADGRGGYYVTRVRVGLR